jgi:2-polyprenyl-6-methoxyphenol hydroxylase-like FAD-dependent oxidoreductase
VCRLPQSPGVTIGRSVAELRRCVLEPGFAGCNLNPGSGMIGAVRGIDPQTGHHFDDTRRYIDALGLPSGARDTVCELNARREPGCRPGRPGEWWPGCRRTGPVYFQCSPDEDTDAWSEDRIWAELQARVAGPDGFTLAEGPITDKAILRFRSFVAEPMRYGRLLLAGDAAHTVPPACAKGLNLALADVRVFAEVLERAVRHGDAAALDEYGPRALARVWKAQHFSYWMTTMLHALPGASEFDLRRQLSELGSVAGSTAGSTYLAEAYTGWPSR